MAERINSFRFKDPEIKDGNVVVPIQVKIPGMYGSQRVNVYLTKGQHETLEQEAIDAQNAIDEIK